MVLSSLRLKDFRNYISAELSFCDRINFFHGLNGQGKTSVLEAIYYLSLSKSFRTQDDLTVIRFDAPYLEVEGLFEKDQRSLVNQVRVVVHRTDGKSVLVDKRRLDRLADLVGQFPSVVAAPEDVLIISGAPSGRRRWLDIAISQVQSVYLKDLQIYRQALRQRNALLLESAVQPDSLDVWDRELSQTGARLIRARKFYLERLSPYVEDVYRSISDGNETIGLGYRSSIEWEAEDLLENTFLTQLRTARSRDILRRSSTVGPHKDEVVFELGGHPFREYASQGQFKTLAVAIRFAEFLCMSDHHDRIPLLLLDDVFSELDANRRYHLMAYLDRAHQVFITGTEPWEKALSKQEIRLFEVEDAHVEAVH